ncbi:hypothetical protein HPB51_009031 [Rhipicephalus microplus]|uniref:Uncharacterized protein n=1 Tax=Rhipicephalus microplus TaxID=6941 RepID=A0A9J6D997_RHIMP|nr:hypothetical protein HPB51_009031 [Rhipicephalus microplus]
MATSKKVINIPKYSGAPEDIPFDKLLRLLEEPTTERGSVARRRSGFERLRTALTVDAELARGLPNLGPTDKSRRRRGLKVQLPRPGLLCATWERPRERSRFFFRIAAWHPPTGKAAFPSRLKGALEGPHQSLIGLRLHQALLVAAAPIATRQPRRSARIGSRCAQVASNFCTSPGTASMFSG